jgi:hypothetical protein
MRGSAVWGLLGVCGSFERMRLMSEPNKLRDDPGSAPESGDPGESGRDHGKVIGEKGQKDDPMSRDSSDGTGEQFETGRQDAVPRAGA